MLFSFVVYVFLSLYIDHRYLHLLTHSFPSRRSSDRPTNPGHLRRELILLQPHPFVRGRLLVVRGLEQELSRRVEVARFPAGGGSEDEPAVVPVRHARGDADAVVAAGIRGPAEHLPGRLLRRRSEASRVGKEWGSTVELWWLPLY